MRIIPSALFILILVQSIVYGESYGTGFFISRHGYIVTNSHVVNGDKKIVVHYDKQKYKAKLVVDYIEKDLALLKIQANKDTHFLNFGESNTVKLGDEVFTIGFPNPHIQGVSPKLTKGSISSNKGIFDDPSRFQISVPIQPGNSGGALVDAETGMVVGVTSGGLSRIGMASKHGQIPEGVNYAIKSEWAARLEKFTVEDEEDIMAVINGETSLVADMLKLSPEQSGETLYKQVEKATVLIVTNPTNKTVNTPKDKAKRDDKAKAEYLGLRYIYGAIAEIGEPHHLYSDPIHYYGKAMSKYQAIKGAESYNKLWPERDIKVEGILRVNKISQDRYTLVIRSQYMIKNPKESKLSQLETEITVNTATSRILKVVNLKEEPKQITLDEFYRIAYRWKENRPSLDSLKN